MGEGGLMLCRECTVKGLILTISYFPTKYDIFPGMQHRKKLLRTEKLHVPDTHEVYANPSVPGVIKDPDRTVWDDQI